MKYVKGGGLLPAIIVPKFSRLWSSVLCLAAQNRSDRADRWLLLLACVVVFERSVVKGGLYLWCRPA